MTTQYIIALGSNLDSKIAFDIATNALKKMGDMAMSSITMDKDFTGKTDCIYHNAVVFLSLFEPMMYDELNLVLKNIEKQCGRNDDKTQMSIQVPMDLDILAFYQADEWCVVKKRYPFKLHEKKGLIEVAPFLLSHS